MGQASLTGLQTGIALPHEEEFELYHNPFSTCSMKVRLCMAELGIPYKSRPVDLIETGSYENVRPAYAAINPGKTVPTLVHNGHPVYESDEQIVYAAQHAPRNAPALMPSEPQIRAEVELWIAKASISHDPLNEMELSAGNAIPGQTMVLFAAMIEKIPYRNIFEGFRLHFDKRRPALFTLLKLMGFSALRYLPMLRKLVAASHRYMNEHLDGLERQLEKSGGPWITGKQFTMADVSLLVILERLRQADALEDFIDEERRPYCRWYWQACTMRPAYREAILDQQHPLVDYATRRIQEAKAAGQLS